MGTQKRSSLAREAERLFGVAPSSDWLAFAERFPSGWRGEDALAEWVEATDLAEVVPLEDVQELFALPRSKEDVATWSAHLWPHAYPVGRAANGDVFVQVAAGRRRGAIVRVDHETFDAPTEWAQSTDALVDALLEEPGEIVADSMPSLCARIVAGRRPTSPSARSLELPCGMQSMDVDGDRVLLGPSYGGGPITLVRGGRVTPLAVRRANVQRVVLRGARIVSLSFPEGLELSVDEGASFRRLDVDGATDATLADGTLWVAREGELGWSTDDGARFEWRKSPARARLVGFVPTTHGMTIVAFDQLTFVSPEGVRVTRPRRSSRVMAVTETPSRTLVAVVDAVGALRSTDGGNTWRKGKGSPPGGEHAVTLRDGSVVVFDGKQVFRSVDDGVSYVRVRILRDEVVGVAPFEEGLVWLGSRLEWMAARELADGGGKGGKARRRGGKSDAD
jgi:hypothetical protein